MRSSAESRVRPLLLGLQPGGQMPLGLKLLRVTVDIRVAVNDGRGQQQFSPGRHPVTLEFE